MCNVQTTANRGRELASEYERRRDALAEHSDRTFSAAKFGEYARAATDVRASTTEDVRDAEREFHHTAFRNKQRWYARLINAIASLAVLGGDPLLFMGDYKYVLF